MTIAAHLHGQNEYDHGFLCECIKRLAGRFPHHHFILFHQEETCKNLPLNCTMVRIAPQLKSNLLLHYWFNYKLPGLLLRYNADVLVTENMVISLRTKIPQLMLVTEKNLLRNKRDKNIPGYVYLQQLLPRFLRKSTAICITERFSSSRLEKIIPGISSKTRLLHRGLNEAFQPCSWEERQLIADKYCAGNDYFLLPVTESAQGHVLEVLKAFSIFKKWQKSSLRMLLLLKATSPSRMFQKLNSYKYRDEIHVIEPANTPEEAAIVAAAYCVIDLSSETPPLALHSLQAGVPVIVSDHESQRATFGDAAIFSAPQHLQLAEKMMAIYKDEEMRKTIISKGMELAREYNWDLAATALWETIPGVPES